MGPLDFCGTMPLGFLGIISLQLKEFTKYSLKFFPGLNLGCFSHTLDLVFKLRLCHHGPFGFMRNSIIYSSAIFELLIYPLNSTCKLLVPTPQTYFFLQYLFKYSSLRSASTLNILPQQQLDQSHHIIHYIYCLPSYIWPSFTKYFATH